MTNESSGPDGAAQTEFWADEPKATLVTSVSAVQASRR